jgi:hypothetical protein
MQFEVVTGSPENFTWNSGIELVGYEDISVAVTRFDTVSSSMNVSQAVKLNTVVLDAATGTVRATVDGTLPPGKYDVRLVVEKPARIEYYPSGLELKVIQNAGGGDEEPEEPGDWAGEYVSTFADFTINDSPQGSPTQKLVWPAGLETADNFMVTEVLFGATHDFLLLGEETSKGIVVELLEEPAESSVAVNFMDTTTGGAYQDTQQLTLNEPFEIPEVPGSVVVYVSASGTPDEEDTFTVRLSHAE